MKIETIQATQWKILNYFYGFFSLTKSNSILLLINIWLFNTAFYSANKAKGIINFSKLKSQNLINTHTLFHCKEEQMEIDIRSMMNED